MLDYLPDSLWVWAGDNDIVAALGSGNVAESVPAGNAVHWYENTATLPTPVFVQRVVSTATTNARFAVALDFNADGAWSSPFPFRVCAFARRYPRAWQCREACRAVVSAVPLWCSHLCVHVLR
jgi:hypothetical protein